MTISIHIAVHNAEAYIEQAVYSALAAADSAEVRVCDDGSTDKTRMILQTLTRQHDRLQVISFTQRCGCAAARNRLLADTQAEYIVPLDGDDLLLPGWLIEAEKHLASHSDCAGVYAKMLRVDSALTPTGAVQGGAFSRFNYCYINPVCHGGIMLQRAALQDCGAYMETGLGSDSVALDGFLWYRFGLQYNLHFIDDQWAYLYREHPRQMTKQNNKYQLCNQYMMNYMLGLNPELAQQLLANSPPCLITPPQRNHAMFVLGILSRKTAVGSAAHAAVLARAAAIDANDYGVNLRRHIHYMTTGQAAAARNEAEKLLQRHADSRYLTMMGHNLLAQASQKLGDIAAANHHNSCYQTLLQDYMKVDL